MHDPLASAIDLFGTSVLRATALLLTGLVLAVAFRHSAAAARRGIWAAALTALLLLPLAHAILPELPLPLVRRTPAVPFDGASGGANVGPLVPDQIEAPPVRGEEATGLATRGSRSRGQPWIVVGLAVWAAGLFVLLGRTWRAHGRVRALLRSATEGRRVGGVDLRFTEEVDLPMTVGLWAPVVLMPARARTEWSRSLFDAALAHESAHVRRRDPVFQLVADLACAIHWFHPLVWLAARRLRTERELAADDAALAAGARPSEYAAGLLELMMGPVLAGPPPPGALVSLLTPAGLKGRLHRILDSRSRRRIAGPAGIALGLLGLVAFVSAAAGVPSNPPADVDPGARLRSPSVSEEGPAVIQVVDGSSRPVPGAEVDFYLRGRGPADAIRAWTDERGLVRLPSTDYVPGGIVAYVRKGRLAARTALLALPRAEEAPRRVSLEPRQVVSGTVMNDGGLPVAGATVRFDGAEPWAVAPGDETHAVSGPDGRFRLEGVLHGNFRLLAESPWGTAGVFLARVQSNDVSELRVTVPRRWPVSGRLIDGAGRPVARARLTRVRRLAGQRRHVDWDESAADGSFALLPLGDRINARAELPDGTILLATFSDRGEVHVVETGSGFPARLDWRLPDRQPETIILQRAAYVRGIATLPGHNLASGARVLAISMAGAESAQATVGSAGEFRVGPLAPGRNTVGAMLPPAPGRSRAEGWQNVDLSPGEEHTGVVIFLRPSEPGSRP